MDILKQNTFTRPVLAYTKPTTCHWCGGSLRTIRNVYKGKDSERYYDAENCLMRGEDRELRRKATLAGTVCSPWYIGAAAILAVFMLTFTFTGGSRAWAQSHEGHAANHDTYKGWLQSNGFSSCCNGDDPERGVKGDCRPARAYPDDNGQWHVLINGKYRPVPQSAIRDYPTPDGNSHVCEDESHGIMCFVRGLPKS